MRRISIFIVVAVLLGCNSANTSADNEKLAALGSRVTKLSAFWDGEVRYRDTIKSDWTSKQMIDFMKSKRPIMMVPFADCAVKFTRQGKNSAVLICTADEKRALFEDAGCNARLDAAPWKDKEKRNCEFKLDLAAVCAR